MKTVPSISRINYNTGYITGGQELVIQGHGFGGDASIQNGEILNTPVVTIGDVACTVKEFTGE